MRFINLKYVWILALFLSLFLKVGNILYGFDNGPSDTKKEWTEQKDTEEEKKVETDFFITDFSLSHHVHFFFPADVKSFSPESFHVPDYFPEVNTPPPAV